MFGAIEKQSRMVAAASRPEPPLACLFRRSGCEPKPVRFFAFSVASGLWLFVFPRADLKQKADTRPVYHVRSSEFMPFKFTIFYVVTALDSRTNRALGG